MLSPTMENLSSTLNFLLTPLNKYHLHYSKLLHISELQLCNMYTFGWWNVLLEYEATTFPAFYKCCLMVISKDSTSSRPSVIFKYMRADSVSVCTGILEIQSHSMLKACLGSDYVLCLDYVLSAGVHQKVIYAFSFRFVWSRPLTF